MVTTCPGHLQKQHSKKQSWRDGLELRLFMTVSLVGIFGILPCKGEQRSALTEARHDVQTCRSKIFVPVLHRVELEWRSCNISEWSSWLSDSLRPNEEWGDNLGGLRAKDS